jgi:Putative transposase/Transposase zinc-binding domain
MTRPRLEVADIIRGHGDDFLDRYGEALSPAQRRALIDLACCRTAALGGHLEQCERCGHRQISYNSCRNRHCPKCQATESAHWVEARAADLLPVPYFHVVFTLPATLGPIALQNPREVYGLLFRAASETLLEIAADPEHLGAEIGLLAMLHTWGQTLQHHPHLHCVVPGGGLSPDRSRWVACHDGFFLPVRVLGRVFRGKFLAGLRARFDRAKLSFRGGLAALADADEFRRRLTASARTDWVVYAKPPFGGPEQVLKYLARYTHRVALSNHRLLELKDGRVRFGYKDYARGGKRRVMELNASEFLRRFLQHVLPAGFVRIRSYGFLANRGRREKVALCRELLGVPAASGVGPPGGGDGSAVAITPVRCPVLCPACGEGRMVVIAEVPPTPTGRGRGGRSIAAPVFDTS